MLLFFWDLSERFIRTLTGESQKFGHENRLLTIPIPGVFRTLAHLITKLITSRAIQAFPWLLGLSESSRIKPFLDLRGRRRRKQGFDSPRLQVLCVQLLTKNV